MSFDRLRFDVPILQTCRIFNCELFEGLWSISQETQSFIIIIDKDNVLTDLIDSIIVRKN
jgi:hypothetical protein